MGDEGTPEEDPEPGSEISPVRVGPEKWALLVFVLLGILFLVEGVSTWRMARDYIRTREREERFEVVQKTLADYLRLLTDAETGQRGYFLTGRLDYLGPYNAGLSRLVPKENELRQLADGRPRLLDDLRLLIRLRERKISELERTIILRQTKGLPSALRLVDSDLGNHLMDQIRHRIRRISLREQSNLLKTRKEGSIRAEKTGRNLIALGAVLLAVFFVSYALIFRAELERRRLLSILGREASHDSLTGLPNRNFFLQMLEYALARAGRENRRLAVLFIDLDGFKGVNDRFGHSIGDRVLIEVARRFSGTLRSGDVLARLGGDEFVVCMPDLSEGGDAAGLSRRLIDSLFLSTHPILEETTPVSCSIGIAIFPEEGRTVRDLMRSADLAMYRAKEAGKGRFFFARVSLNEEFAGSTPRTVSPGPSLPGVRTTSSKT